MQTPIEVRKGAVIHEAIEGQSAFYSLGPAPNLTTLPVHGPDMRIYASCLQSATRLRSPAQSKARRGWRGSVCMLHGENRLGPGGAVTGPGLIHGDSVGRKAQGALAETFSFQIASPWRATSPRWRGSSKLGIVIFA